MDRANIQTILPLTGPQEAILIHKLQSGGTANIQVRFTVEGGVDDATMADAWQAVVARHDALRTLIHVPGNGKAMQVVLKSATLGIETVDLGGLPEAEQDRRIAERVAADAGVELPLKQAPASRLTVFLRAQDQRDYLWTVSKLLLDGWSAVLVLGEVMEHYRAQRDGTRADLPATPALQDHAAALKAVTTDVSQAFWAEMFAGYKGRGRLFPTTPAGSVEKGRLALPEALWPDVERAAAALGVTPTAFVSGGWALFLSCCTGAEDQTFALSLSGRSLEIAGIDRLVGPLATTAPRRARISPDTSVAALVKGLHQAGFRAQAHESLSPLEIFGGSEVTRNVAVPETLLTVETLPEHAFEIPTDGGLRLSGFRSDVASGFPVTLVVIPGAEAEFHYLFQNLADPEYARQMLEGFPTLLAEMTRNPTGSLGRLRTKHEVSHRRTPAMPAVVGGPRTPVELAIAEIWKDVLGLDEVDMTRDFASHGGRSFAAVRVLARIDDAFGTRLPLPDFIGAGNIPDLSRLVMRDLAQASDLRTLVPFRTKGTKPAVLFVHLGPHPVSFLWPLFARLDKDRPFLAVQPVGVGSFDAPLTRFEALARLHVAEFEKLTPDGAVDVVGNCGGARLAVEVARQLRARGRDVRQVIAIDTRPPRVRGAVAPGALTSPTARPRRIKPLRRLIGLTRFVSRMARLAYAKATHDIEGRLAIHAEIVERACYIADDAYRSDPMPGQLTVIHTREDRPKAGEWVALSERVEHLTLPVGHFTMFFEPDVDTLAAGLRERFEAMDGLEASQVAPRPEVGQSREAAAVR